MSAATDEPANAIPRSPETKIGSGCPGSPTEYTVKGIRLTLMAASHLFVPKDSLESEAKQTLFSVRQTMHKVMLSPERRESMG